VLIRARDGVVGAARELDPDRCIRGYRRPTASSRRLSRVRHKLLVPITPLWFEMPDPSGKVVRRAGIVWCRPLGRIDRGDRR